MTILFYKARELMEEEKEQFNSEVPVKQKKSHPKAQLIVQRFSKKRKNNNKSSR